MTRVIALLVLLLLPGCALQAAADCMANPAAPCESDEE